MLAIRSSIGGLFMGLANLVPGISGGTMLLAVGIYPQFINAIAELTTLKPSRRSLLVLGLIIMAALVAFVALAGTITFLVIHYRWAMYSLFIGLTLGGVPVVWKLIRKPTLAVWGGAVAGFIGMALLAIVQAAGTSTSTAANETFIYLMLAGAVGASAMILPGVSGAYLLLIMGVYLTITSAISEFKNALLHIDIAAALPIGLHILLPIAIGVVVGVLIVSNLIKFLLQRYEKATLGVLLGLLLGAVVGLWPFQQTIPPEHGDTINGKTVVVESLLVDDVQQITYTYAENEKPVKAKYWPSVFFTPTAMQIIFALLLIAAGFGITLAVAQLNREPGTAGSL